MSSICVKCGEPKNPSERCMNCRKNYFAQNPEKWEQYYREYQAEWLKDPENKKKVAKFDEKMSWENYGTYWHLDHIIPQSLLPHSDMSEENFKKCWNLSNLQPLEKIENLKKGNKLSWKKEKP